MMNTTILSSHGRLIKSSSVLHNLEIDGLDSRTQFDALQIFSNYTVRNALRWESLKIRIQARVVLQASSQKQIYCYTTAGQISRPTLEGFVNTGLDWIASSAVQALLIMQYHLSKEALLQQRISVHETKKIEKAAVFAGPCFAGAAQVLMPFLK